ncbi:hypothetical protein ACQP2P_14870 [Dactylosporangium sp. CA-139114]|uniref:hypothetical protein n=1 Tax=Dactylosporangium sp. CA-139114 TaxID=3239931 RepID=UPI003D994A69
MIVPAGTVAEVDQAARVIHLDRTSAQVRRSPGYDPATVARPRYYDRVAHSFAGTYRTPARDALLHRGGRWYARTADVGYTLSVPAALRTQVGTGRAGVQRDRESSPTAAHCTKSTRELLAHERRHQHRVPPALRRRDARR